MTDTLPPERLEELAAGYVLGDLSSEEAEEFQTWLQRDPQLTLEVDRLYEVLGVMPYGLPPTPPPPNLRDRILEAAVTDEAALQTDDSSVVEFTPRRVGALTKRHRRRLPWKPIASSIAALVVVAFAVDNWRLRRDLIQVREQTTEQFDFGSIEMPPEAVLANQWDGLEKIVDDHLSAMTRDEGPMDFNSSELSDIIERFDRQFNFAQANPTIDRRGVTLMGGTLCEFGKIPGLRYTYMTDDGNTISFYQIDTRTEKLSLPKTGSGKLYISQPGKPRVVLWSDDTYIYAMVAELPPDQLKALSYDVVMQ
ncbi:MAG: hypothetical protein J7641_13940 [Cyanobacteria bacterium SID2]|nr:hypothetical protein [Cyanobacteria bacterium SID2]MBP0002796.1 hypothetical protein [Cyanobacteria bacterium SBC]